MDDQPNPSPATERRWLCIAYAFPPINRSGTHRTLGFVRHLARAGWPASVVTVIPAGEALDEAAVASIPRSTRVIRTRCVDFIALIKAIPSCLSRVLGRRLIATARETDESVASTNAVVARSGSVRDYVSRWLTTPDSRLGWVAPAVAACITEIRRQRPAVLYSTSPCMSAHLVALIVSHLTRVPWVADFRDPWRGNPFRNLDYRSIDWWDRVLERWVMRRADRIICNTPTLEQDSRDRHPIARHKSTTILNAFDKEWLTAVKPKRCVGEHRFMITHCGQFYGRRSPHVWFTALRELLDSAPDVARRLRFVLIGDENYHGKPLREMAAGRGVGELILVLGRRSHHDALCHLRGSDALALAAASGPGAELQVPNKLFEYLAMRRPIVAAVCSANPATAILRASGAVAEICEPDDAAALAEAIRRITLVDRSSRRGRWQNVDAFERGRRATELIAVFGEVADPSARRAGRVTRNAAMPPYELLLPPRRVFDDISGSVYR